MLIKNKKNTVAGLLPSPVKGGRVCAALLLACATAQADSYRLPYQGTAAAGQGEAFAAQADDASALYYNPAGLARLKGVQVSAGMSLVGGDVQFTSKTGQKYYADFGGDFAFPAPSNFYLTANLKDLGFNALGPLTLGLGVTSPYGLAARWNGTTPFTSIVTRARLPMLDIKPTLAYAVNDMIAFGLGLDIYTFASFIGSGGLELNALVPGVASTQINGNGTMVGYNASLLVTPWRNEAGQPLLNVGFVYRSGGDFGLNGTYIVNGAMMAKAKTALTLPDIFVGAVAGWPIRDRSHEWKIEYDMEFVQWSAVKTVDIYLSSGQEMHIPQNWHSIYTASLGTEFKWLESSVLPDWDIALRAGYQHSNNPIPDYTFSPQLADNTWDGVAIGLGLSCRDKGRFLGLLECGNNDNKAFTARRMGLDLAFQAFFYTPRYVAANIQPSAEGRYQNSAFVGSLNFNLSY